VNIGDIATKLGLFRDPNLCDPKRKLTDDDLDSIICALACIDIEKHSLTGARLAHVIEGKLREQLGCHSIDLPSSEPPRGYVLLGSLPTQRIRIRWQDISSMEGLRAAMEQI
jgi:hypothetical protein